MRPKAAPQPILGCPDESQVKRAGRRVGKRGFYGVAAFSKGLTADVLYAAIGAIILRLVELERTAERWA